MTQPNTTGDSYILLVAIDYSEISALALSEAVRLAGAHDRSQIHVVHALAGIQALPHGLGTPDVTAQPVLQVPSPEFNAQMAADLQAYVEKVLTAHGSPTGSPDPQRCVTWTMHFRTSDPTTAIVQLAADLEADLVVVGTHGRNWLSRFLLGSVAEAVVRRAPCPVMVVRPVGARAESAGPKIEPPCPECLQTRRASGGAQFWCKRHQDHHERAHTYHFTPFRESHQSGLLLHPLK